MNIISIYCQHKTIIIVLFDNNSIQNISLKTINNIEKLLVGIKLKVILKLMETLLQMKKIIIKLI